MAAIQVLNGELYKGLKMFREVDYFIGGIKTPKITVFYYEYLESPTGDKIEEKYKKYHIIDQPEVLDTEGGVITPANPGYTTWKEKPIIVQYVGLQLGTHLIIGSINQKLAQMPFEVLDDHIANPNE